MRLFHVFVLVLLVSSFAWASESTCDEDDEDCEMPSTATGSNPFAHDPVLTPFLNAARENGLAQARVRVIASLVFITEFSIVIHTVCDAHSSSRHR
jgi:hypothetical protein